MAQKANIARSKCMTICYGSHSDSQNKLLLCSKPSLYEFLETHPDPKSRKPLPVYTERPITSERNSCWGGGYPLYCFPFSTCYKGNILKFDNYWGSSFPPPAPPPAASDGPKEVRRIFMQKPQTGGNLLPNP